MNQRILSFFVPLLWTLTAAALYAGEPALPSHLIQAVNSEGRPAQDRERDAQRKPAEVLAFIGVNPGDKVADLMTGGGYYSDILARAVGPQGKVYAHNTPFVIERFAGPAITKRLENPELANVVRIDSELENPGLPKNLDAIMMVLFYHDTYWQGIDRVKMNSAVFEALKPGGIYTIIDHQAQPGSGDRDVKTLHRVDADLVKKEILAAGFEWVGSSDLLSHPEDTRDYNVFRDVRENRDKTDRFLFKFRKTLK